MSLGRQSSISFAQPFERDAQFWVPADTDILKIYGKLLYEPNSDIKIEVFGDFAERVPFAAESAKYPVIWGLLPDNTKFTLFNLYHQGGHTSFKGYQSAVYSAQVLILNGHFYEKSFFASGVRLKFKNFNEWLCARSYSYNAKFTRDGDEAPFTYIPPITFEFGVTKIGAEFKLEYLTKLKNDGRLDVSTESEYFLDADFNLGRDLFEVKSIMFNLGNLLSLFVGSSCFLESCSLKHDGKILHCLYPYRFNNSDESVDRHRMITPYPMVKENLPSIFEEWFSKDEYLEPVTDLFFANFHNEDQFVQTQFLNYVIALESFHKETFDAHVESKEEFDKKVRLACDALLGKKTGLDEQTIQIFSRKIKEANNKGLTKKIHEIIDRHCLSKVLLDLFGNKEKFVKDVVSLRNALVHQKSEDKRRKVDPINSMILVHKLKLLLYLCLFSEIGLVAANYEENILRYFHYIKRNERPSSD